MPCTHHERSSGRLNSASRSCQILGPIVQNSVRKVNGVTRGQLNSRVGLHLRSERPLFEGSTCAGPNALFIGPCYGEPFELVCKILTSITGYHFVRASGKEEMNFSIRGKVQTERFEY